MDVRLFTIGANRPGDIRAQDIPRLASALVGYVKGITKVGAGVTRNLSYVRLKSPQDEILVLGEDWVKMLTMLRDGTLSNQLLPSPAKGVIDPDLTRVGQDYGDPTLYNRVLVSLKTIFADAPAYPIQQSFTTFSPYSVSGLSAWLDTSKVSTSGSDVSVWPDLAAGQNAYQLTPANRPTLVPNALNGKPAIAFSGSQWLDFPLRGLTDWSVFVVGKYETSVTEPIGGFVVASGFDGNGSGLDCYVKQNGSSLVLPGPQGRLSTWLFGDLAPISVYNPAAPPSTFKLFYWMQSSRLNGSSRARIGLGDEVDLAAIASLTPYDLSQEGWDPTQQLGGNPPPLLAAIGRYSGPLAGGPTFYLNGAVCSVLIYDRVVTGQEFTALTTFLNSEWGGTLL